MRFEAIASSSHGNAYLVTDGKTRILLECGLAFRTLQKKVGFSLMELDGVLVTHEHKDHARCAAELARNGQTVYMSAGTALALGLAEEKPLRFVLCGGARGTDSSASLRFAQNDARGTDSSASLGMTGGTDSSVSLGMTSGGTGGLGSAVAVVGCPGVELVEHRDQVRIGSFDVVAFATYHDAAEPMGYLIRSREDGDVLVFATDTVNLRYRFPGLRLLAIEANYQESILDRSQRLPDKTKSRIRNTHMEIDTLCDILRGMDLRECREIWLLHLSDAMSHEDQFINKVRRVVPLWVTVQAAGRGTDSSAPLRDTQNDRRGRGDGGPRGSAAPTARRMTETGSR